MTNHHTAIQASLQHDILVKWLHDWLCLVSYCQMVMMLMCCSVADLRSRRKGSEQRAIIYYRTVTLMSAKMSKLTRRSDASECILCVCCQSACYSCIAFLLSWVLLISYY